MLRAGLTDKLDTMEDFTLFAPSEQAEWRLLIGPDPSRYCAIIGLDLCHLCLSSLINNIPTVFCNKIFARITGEVLDIMGSLPDTVKRMTGVDISAKMITVQD